MRLRSHRFNLQMGLILFLTILPAISTNSSDRLVSNQQSPLARIDKIIINGQVVSNPNIDLVKVVRASDNKEVAGEFGLSLYANDRVITGAAKIVLYSFDGSDNRRVTLGENTSVIVKDQSVTLTFGRIWVKATGVFSVKTLYWVLGVPGTEFFVEITPPNKEDKNVPEKSNLSVLEGAVDVSPLKSDSVAARFQKIPAQKTTKPSESRVLVVKKFEEVDLEGGQPLPATARPLSPEKFSYLSQVIAHVEAAGNNDEQQPTTQPSAAEPFLQDLSARLTARGAGLRAADIVLSPFIPGDAQFAPLPPNATDTEKLLAIQGDFDIYSWNTFIALNWPPGPDGNGDPNKTIGQNVDNDTVWERYRDVADIFLPGGATPSWNGPVSVPTQCKASYKPGMRILSQVGKTPTLLTDFSQPFNTGPLIDQNGNYTRYEVLVNKPMFDYILANKLYSKAGQQAFKGKVQFPCGAPNGPEGAIMVQSSWKVINPAERGRFHTKTVLVYSPASQNPKYPASCSTKLMGLVGLHLGHKTNSGAQWLWSTFEHVDNAPTEADVASNKFKSKYNYYNPNCTAANCPPNRVPPRPWNPTIVSSFHTQVVRMNMFKGNEFAFESAAARNADALQLLLGVNNKSVWQNYELISTMWPTNTGKCQPTPGDPLGTPVPNFLANTTLETYIQGMVPNVSSNCIECHNNATMTTSVPSDFTYILQRAQ